MAGRFVQEKVTLLSRDSRGGMRRITTGILVRLSEREGQLEFEIENGSLRYLAARTDWLPGGVIDGVYCFANGDSLVVSPCGIEPAPPAPFPRERFLPS